MKQAPGYNSCAAWTREAAACCARVALKGSGRRGPELGVGDEPGCRKTAQGYHTQDGLTWVDESGQELGQGAGKPGTDLVFEETEGVRNHQRSRGPGT